jgi:transcriptional regulator with XRE-family HTH domain
MSIRLIVARKARKLTQVELSEQLGISQGLLSRIENGKLNGSIETAKVRDALGPDMFKFLLMGDQ